MLGRHCLCLSIVASWLPPYSQPWLGRLSASRPSLSFSTDSLVVNGFLVRGWANSRLLGRDWAISWLSLGFSADSLVHGHFLGRAWADSRLLSRGWAESWFLGLGWDESRLLARAWVDSQLISRGWAESRFLGRLLADSLIACLYPLASSLSVWLLSWMVNDT